MPFVNWNDVYHELWLQAAQSRGTITSVGELPGATRYSTLPEWPRTTGADAIAIASLVDPILSATPLRPGGYGITRLWQTAVCEIEAIAFPNPAAEYVHNRALWSTLLAVAAHLSTLGAPVPDDGAWDTLLAELWSPAIAYRNASGPAMRTLAAPTYPSMWTTLRAELAQARGYDLRDDELGGWIQVPRTTNTDVIRLAAYWSRALLQLQVKVMTGVVPSPEDFEDLQLQWQAATDDVDQVARHDKPEEVYPDNLALWRASHALAAALGVLEDGPPPYEIAMPTPSRPPPPAPSPPKATDLSSRLNEAADGAMNAFAHFVHDASNRVVASVGRPLLAAGATVAALILILRGTAGCDCDCDHEATPDREAA